MERPGLQLRLSHLLDLSPRLQTKTPKQRKTFTSSSLLLESKFSNTLGWQDSPWHFPRARAPAVPKPGSMTNRPRASVSLTEVVPRLLVGCFLLSLTLRKAVGVYLCNSSKLRIWPQSLRLYLHSQVPRHSTRQLRLEVDEKRPVKHNKCFGVLRDTDLSSDPCFANILVIPKTYIASSWALLLCP